MKCLKKHWWKVIFTGALILGFVLGISGFIETGETKHKLGNSLYETFRLFERKYHSDDIPPNLIAAQWILLFAFLWLSLKIIITIIAPNFLSDIWIRLFYKKHIVICGLNRITLNLINEYKNEKIIVLAEEVDKHAASLKQKGVKLFFCGDLSDADFLRKAKIKAANQLYIVTDNDKENVEITQSVLSLLKKKNRSAALKCYTLIKDRELKILLEESVLFKYRTESLDSILFNVNEMGIKYGLSRVIDKILPEYMEIPPELLIVGLTGKAETVLLNLAHCLTMKRKAFRFTIVEKDRETIASFKQKYFYLQDFTEIKYADNLEEACQNKGFTSVFVCLENQIKAVKTAIAIRYTLADNAPNIFMFSEESENLIDVFNTKGNNILTLKDRNIFLINTFEKTIEYIVKLNPEIEMLAETAHNHWRTFIATGKKFGSTGQSSPAVFFEKDKETLAMIEHRRWMIEKYGNGWRYDNNRNDKFKIHNNLTTWEKLTDSEKKKDYIAIDLMINRLNNQTV
ncbi:MAG: NAD-binding protein [Dysgonamonadaceae bacterium]|jgi:hypothetical protein|nr:NAD-binding protein [Dysgonamonadaceae bacterium]